MNLGLSCGVVASIVWWVVVRVSHHATPSYRQDGQALEVRTIRAAPIASAEQIVAKSGLVFQSRLSQTHRCKTGKSGAGRKKATLTTVAKR